MKHAFILLALFCTLAGHALSNSEEMKKVEVLHVLGSVNHPGPVKYQDRMNLHQAIKELNPSRLWNGYVTIKDAVTGNQLSYRFRPADGDALKEAMKRVMVSRGDVIWFHENST